MGNIHRELGYYRKLVSIPSHFLLETHVSGLKAKKMTNSFNFDGTFIVDEVGFSGSIWCLWRKDFW